jgi:phytanoyl-CoA hydroxylase
MLSQADLAAYRRDGFIVVANVLNQAEVQALRRVTDEFVRNACTVAANDDIYGLEDSHSPSAPRVRRIKTPHLHHPEYARVARHLKIVEVLADLWGTVRFDTGKLNVKSAGRRSNGTRIGRSTRTPMMISPRSASCSTIARSRTAR